MSLIDVTETLARRQGDKTFLVHLADGRSPTETLTYQELRDKARKIGAWLQTQCAPQDRVVLAMSSPAAFLPALLACFYARVVAVPITPPQSRFQAERLTPVLHDARPGLALTDAPLRPEAAAASAPELRWMTQEAWGQFDGELAEDSDRGRGLAFLQYTSGSTGQPKGVMISHENIQHNLEMMAATFEARADVVTVSWLPLFHDMGLIGMALDTLFVGGKLVTMPPAVFLQKPVRLLEAISAYQGQVTACPNFAYDLLADVDVPDHIDLSTWRVAINGAEPVKWDTVRRLQQRLEPFGFKAHALRPAYGLAEATLLVAATAPGQPPSMRRFDRAALAEGRVVDEAETDAMTAVSAGAPIAAGSVRIVDDQGCARGPREVGEIWLRSPSVSEGYWREGKADRSELRTLREDGGGPYLPTGDIGALVEGELFVLGRKKDVIIVRGQNHYPADIEATAERAHLALAPGGAAAFTLDTGDDARLVLVAEVRRDQRRGLDVDAVCRAIRSHVAQRNGLSVWEIRLVSLGRLPRTSSGKVMRSRCRELHLENDLPTLGQWRFSTRSLQPEPTA